jgi:conjugative transfer ATPase
MNYEPKRDKLSRKIRLVFSSDLANLLPFYGRSKGTGNPGLVFFNRGGEPLTFDPLNKNDRAKNAFGLVLGPPGSGKSALMVYILLQVAAIYGARIYVIEKGGSFKLFGDYCKYFGLSVNQVTLHPKEDVSLPPFSDAYEMLEREAAKQRTLNSEASLDASDSDDEDDEERDLLGEMELKARIMITGGDIKEEALMSRADRLTIRQAIIKAAQAKLASDSNEIVLTEDVVAALNQISLEEESTPKRRERAKDMADAMALYCSGTAGHFFNRPGKAWPEADVTILEMGLLANEGYEDQLALGFMGLMNQINGVVEREQYAHRPTFVLGDEAHLITTNPLLAIFLVKIVKMWRKLGAWLWLATQNLEDFPDTAKKLLSMFEWWIAMVCPKEEIEQISRFKDLTDEQKHMLLAARKEPGKYTEGVVLADTLQCLFRNVPPPLALALAMTEKHEKQQRAEIMKAQHCSELEAAFSVADDLAKSR